MSTYDTPGLDPWDRQPGESSKRHHAFQLYLEMKPHERSVRAVQRRLALKSARHLYKWSKEHDWPGRVAAWDDEQSRIRRMADNEALKDMARKHYNLADHMLGVAAVHVQQLARKAKEATGSGQDLDLLDPKDIPRWAKAVVDIQRLSLGSPIVLTVDENGVATSRGASGDDASRWRELYCPEAEEFRPHPGQVRLIRSSARFAVAAAGADSGKTSAGAVALWRRILDGRADRIASGQLGHYWLIAPNDAVGEDMAEAFEKFAPPGEIVSRRGRAAANKQWELRSGDRVQAYSGRYADPSVLACRRVNGAWLDEFTLIEEDVWVEAVRQRLLSTGGWAVLTTKPRGKDGWPYQEVWRRTIPGDAERDEDYEGVTWRTIDNPSITAEAEAAARRSLQPEVYRREWEASWDEDPRHDQRGSVTRIDPDSLPVEVRRSLLESMEGGDT